MGTQNAPNLVESHAYTLLSVSNVGGVNHYIVRNPWGESGDSLENSQGIATLTYAQFVVICRERYGLTRTCRSGFLTRSSRSAAEVR